MRFLYVNDNVPETTSSLLRLECARRGVDFDEIDAPHFAFDPGRQADAGDLLYRAAVSNVAARVEQFLFHPRCATFYADPEGPLFGYLDARLIHGRAGISIPRSCQLSSNDRDYLRSVAAELGGFPLVLKLPGYSGGDGVMKVDSFPALFSLVDYLFIEGRQPQLMAFVDRATHWRVTVVGRRAVASYRNIEEEDDFRTYGSLDPADVMAPMPEGMADLAVRATEALRIETAGVDILEHPSGRLYVLECNFPCYFAHAQEVAGIDVAGAMLDWLIAKARRIAGAASPAAPLRRVFDGRPHAVSGSPRILICDAFLDEAEIAYVLSLGRNEDALRARGIFISRDETGSSCELPVEDDFGLRPILDRVHATLGFEGQITSTFRYRRYQPGDYHPAHTDDYRIGELNLEATAILYLTTPERGGETRFPNAAGGPLQIEPRAGRLALWFNYTADGAVDSRAMHESCPVECGEKITITYFAYRRLRTAEPQF
jgi:2OG-Fe(II) oxygenase superfamily/RimK-like ATP-grasp domain